jgi:hypothetical protein
VARRGWLAPFAPGCAAFAASTVGLAHLHWPAVPTFALVTATLVAGYAVTRQRDPSAQTAIALRKPPRWDIPVRMAAATAVVLAITTLAPVIGPHLAGLLSPFPVFGAVLALFTHHTHGPASGTAVLDGLIMGLAAPAEFFLALALALPQLGFVSFALASLAALIVQIGTMFAMPPASLRPVGRDQPGPRSHRPAPARATACGSH